LSTQAKEKEAQEKQLLAQARQIETQRVSLEHSVHRGQNNSATETQIKSLEEKRVALEHQATEQSKEREKLEHQACELGTQRRNLEQQHKAECGGNNVKAAH
jgi:hypothetical protein